MTAEGLFSVTRMAPGGDPLMDPMLGRYRIMTLPSLNQLASLIPSR